MSRKKSNVDPDEDLKLWLAVEAGGGLSLPAILTANEVAKLLGVNSAVFPILETERLLPRLAKRSGPSCTKYYALRDIIRIRSNPHILEKIVDVNYDYVRKKNATQKRRTNDKSSLTMVPPTKISQAA